MFLRELFENQTLSNQKIIKVIKTARDQGFDGFGGRCFAAAIALNNVLFHGKGEAIGCFNAAFLNRGHIFGHVAIRFNGVFWDADGRPKTFDEIESWGMLDHSDPDYAELADECGLEWSDDAADTVETVHFRTSDLAQYADHDLVMAYESMLAKSGR